MAATRAYPRRPGTGRADVTNPAESSGAGVSISRKNQAFFIRQPTRGPGDPVLLKELSGRSSAIHGTTHGWSVRDWPARGRLVSYLIDGEAASEASDTRSAGAALRKFKLAVVPSAAISCNGMRIAMFVSGAFQLNKRMIRLHQPGRRHFQLLSGRFDMSETGTLSLTNRHVLTVPLP